MEGDVREYEPTFPHEVSGPPARETIFALSSGAPPAAIAIVRISGAEAGAALHSLCGTLPRPRRATLRTVRGADGGPIDRALTLWFPGPATATGEDLAELHLHGGRAVIAAALAALGELPGCRPAAAGEFTRRAFDNGRIDLLQAEGLADLLAAETEGARLRALRLAEGGLSRRIGEWRDRIVMLSARIEAILEFGGDDPDIPPDPAIPRDIAALSAELDACLVMPPAERLRDGIRVVIAGPPNAGKSTLLNALAGREVAIATPIPGTTRDLVEAPVTLGGVALVLIDSAGLRETDDMVERLGIASARRAIDEADIVLWLGDPGEASANAGRITVRAMADLEGQRDGPHCDFAVSARTGQGIAALQHGLLARARALLPPTDLALTQSQTAAVRHARNALRRAACEIEETLCAEHLRVSGAALDEMTGSFAVEPMLDALFGRFCVGK